MERNKPQPIFPWYKERLRTKYLKASSNRISSVSSFCCSANVRLQNLGISPNHALTPGPRKGKELACFSRQMIRKQVSRERVAAVEAELKRRPLTTYAHYKDHMTRELFEKVLSVLDPDVGVNNCCLLPIPATYHTEEEEEEEEEGIEPKSNTREKSKTSVPDVQKHVEKMKATLSLRLLRR